MNTRHTKTMLSVFKTINTFLVKNNYVMSYTVLSKLKL